MLIAKCDISMAIAKWDILVQIANPCRNILLMMDTYIYYFSTFVIDKSIIFQDVEKKHYLLYHVKML